MSHDPKTCTRVKHRIACLECGYPPSEAKYPLGTPQCRECGVAMDDEDDLCGEFGCAGWGNMSHEEACFWGDAK